MRFSNIFRILFVCLFLAMNVSCGDEVAPVKQTVEQNVSIVLSVDKTSLETADIRVRHDGLNDISWVYLNTSDLDTDADELIDSIYETS